MRTRRAAPPDLETLVGLAGALFAEDGGTRDETVDVAWPGAHGRSYYGALLDDVHSLAVVVEDPGVVGFLIGRLGGPDPLRPAVVTARLESMYVRPASRCRGVGRALVDAFHRWADEGGATRSVVTAYAANASARRFYRSLGYGDHEVTLELGRRPLLGTLGR